MTPIDPFTLAPAAFLAGVLMFLAPCTLPIVPGYLAFISGVPAGEEGSKKSKGRILRNALAFVLGFSALFILLGLFAGSLGSLLGPWKGLLTRGAGVLIIIFGLIMLGIFRAPMFMRERRIAIPKFLTLGHPQSSFFIGALFAVGWSPCIGPILGTVLLVASIHATALSGAFLLAVFSLGLGVPFMLTALLIDSAGNFFSKFGRTVQILSYAGGVILVLVGALMLFDKMDLLVAWGFQFLNGPYSRLLQYM